MPGKVAGRAELDGPGGDSPRQRIPESRAGSVVIERSGAIATGWPGGRGRDEARRRRESRRSRLGLEPAGSGRRRCILRHYSAIRRHMPGSRSTARTSARDARAIASPPIPAQRSTTRWTCETSGFMLRDDFRRALLDSDRVDPHLLTTLEFRRGLAPPVEQADRGGDSLRRSQLPKPGYVRGTDRSDLLPQRPAGANRPRWSGPRPRHRRRDRVEGAL